MYSLLIKNAKVIDGSGKPAELLDVAIQGDEIVNIGRGIKSEAQKVIDGSGKFLTPGFIDIQNHSDVYWQLWDNPGLDSLVTQGFTTILVGNCGASLAPLLSHNALLAIQKWHSLEGVNVNWQSFSEYIEELLHTRFGCNVASLVGYATLRRGLLGDQVRPLEKPELTTLQRALEEALDAGAFGMSTGLSYAHEIIISELELFDLAKIVAKKQGLFAIHLRSEGPEVVEAVDEALDIARNAEANLKISHFKIRGLANWEKAEHIFAAIDTAYHRGTRVHYDAYPYDTMWLPLYSYLPKWSYEGGRPAMLKHFANPTQRRKILDFLTNSGVKFSELKVASTANKLNFMGKTIGYIAKNLEVSSEEMVLHLIQNGGSEVMVFEQNMNPSQVQEFVEHPLAFVATDGAGFGKNNLHRLIHPRCFGTAPRFIKQVMEAKRISLEDAIKKLTLAPAEKIGLKRRGKIAVGNFADLVLLDPYKTADKATYDNPYMYSQGIEYVFVNGKPVVEKGKPTGQMPGYTLRKA